MFYSLKEAAEKLSKSEDEIRQLVKSGQLREFRDGPNLLFKVNEVEALMSDTGVMAAKTDEEEPAEPELQTAEADTGAMAIEAEGEEPATIQPELADMMDQDDTGPLATDKEAEKVPVAQPELAEDEILLAPETTDKPGEEIELSEADTAIVEEGIKVLGETDSVSAIGETSGETFKGLEETSVAPSKEASLEEIEQDVSLDTFGSGSGLLDLSLQADDTSLGGILDEIYTPGGEGKPAAAAEPAEGTGMEVAAEADQMLSEAQFPEPQVTAPQLAAAQSMVEPEPDVLSNALGIMLFIPLLAIVYTTVIAVAGFSNVMPEILRGVQGFIWYVAIGLGVASAVIAGAGAMMGREKTAKVPKPKKAKAPKVKKAKKGKKAESPEAKGKTQ